jgi:hypothetical protein
MVAKISEENHAAIFTVSNHVFCSLFYNVINPVFIASLNGKLLGKKRSCSNRGSTSAFSGEDREITKEYSQDSRCLGREVNREPSEHKLMTLVLDLSSSVYRVS